MCHLVLCTMPDMEGRPPYQLRGGEFSPLGPSPEKNCLDLFAIAQLQEQAITALSQTKLYLQELQGFAKNSVPGNWPGPGLHPQN
jgi:hypothetical protein